MAKAVTYRPYRMLQHAWSLAPKGVTTSPRSCSNYTGYQYDSQWNLNSLPWSTRRSTTWHHRICQVTASSLPSPGAVSLDHQKISSTLSLVPVHVLEIKHLTMRLEQFSYRCPDDIHYQMLKHLSSEVLNTLLNILNDIWLTGNFLSSWRQSYVVQLSPHCSH